MALQSGVLASLLLSLCPRRGQRSAGGSGHASGMLSPSAGSSVPLHPQQRAPLAPPAQGSCLYPGFWGQHPHTSPWSALTRGGSGLALCPDTEGWPGGFWGPTARRELKSHQAAGLWWEELELAQKTRPVGDASTRDLAVTPQSPVSDLHRSFSPLGGCGGEEE